MKHSRWTPKLAPLTAMIALALLTKATGCDGTRAHHLDGGAYDAMTGDPPALVVSPDPGETLTVAIADDVSADGASIAALGSLEAGYSVSLLRGQTLSVGIDAGGGDVIAAALLANSSPGDLDLSLVDDAGRTVATSVRPTGHVDWINRDFVSASAPVRRWTYRVVCWATPCVGTLAISRGNSETFVAPGPATYLNQRANTSRSGRCGTLADGECLCGDISAAIGLVDRGFRPVGAASTISEDLFSNVNDSVGRFVAADAVTRLRAVYGIPVADPVWGEAAWTALTTGLRRGGFVVLRSGSFQFGGHVVRVRGYAGSGPTRTLLVDDSYGRASADLSTWATPAGRTNGVGLVGDAYGRGQVYRWADLMRAGSLWAIVGG